MGWFWLFMEIREKGGGSQILGKIHIDWAQHANVIMWGSAPTEPPSGSDGLLLRKIFVWLLKYWTPIRLQLGKMVELTLVFFF